VITVEILKTAVNAEKEAEHMKKALLYGLTLALAFTLIACGLKKPNQQTTEPDPAAASSQSEVSTPEPEPEPPATPAPEPVADKTLAASAETEDTQDQAAPAAQEPAEPEPAPEPVKTEQPKQAKTSSATTEPPKQTETPPATTEPPATEQPQQDPQQQSDGAALGADADLEALLEQQRQRLEELEKNKVNVQPGEGWADDQDDSSKMTPEQIQEAYEMMSESFK